VGNASFDRPLVEELLDAAISAFQHRVNMLNALDVFHAEERPPKRPVIVTDLDQWQAYLEHIEQYERHKLTLESSSQLAKINLEVVQAKLLRLLPGRVWFKRGAFGVGIADTNWGGDKRYIVVEPWRDEMPSLNHQHTGD
jgi:hypothetical protein